MNYLLVFLTGNEIKQVTLKKGEHITVGTGENDTLLLPGSSLLANHLSLNFADNGINILSRTPFNIMGKKSVNIILSAGDTISLSNRTTLTVFESCCNNNNIISLSRLHEISIGRSTKNDICLKGSLVSSRHAVIRRSLKTHKLIIKDRHSRNGIFIDGKLMTSGKQELNNDTVIFIGGFMLEIKNDALRFVNAPGEIIFSPEIIKASVPFLVPKRLSPSFYRSPRIRRAVKNAEVEILPPPNSGTKPSISWLSVLLPPGMMITIMLTMATFTRNVNTLFYTLPMSTVSVIMAIVNYNGQKKKWFQTQELIRQKYNEHLAEKEKEIYEAETKYISTLSLINPGILECISIAETLDRRLWERTLSDSDFLNIRLGTGQVQSNVDVKIPREQLTLEENPFLAEAAKLRDRHQVLNGVPVCHSFLEAPITGLIGNHDDVKKLVWSIVINIAVHHSYEDVKIICVYPEHEREQWEWMRWLPHVWNSERTKRFMSCTLIDKSQKKGQDKTARTMLREISEILKVRQREKSNSRQDNQPEAPFYFLILADKKLVESSGELFLPQSSSLGFAALYAYGDIGALPRECNAIIDCGDPVNEVNASVQMTWEPENSKIFTPDSINLQLSLVDRFARSLAPVRVHESGSSGALPSKVLLFSGLGVKTVEELNILQRWNDSKSYSSLAVPIGIKSNGDMFNFDIQEDSMGPHGVIAGTSGSGKSEMLTAWLLSLAMHFSPKDLNILLIEFKGNDLSNILATLPQIAGVVNNLQVAGMIERSLTSLSAEYERRLRIFESITDLATKSLPAYQKYQKKHQDDKNLEELPYLIVVLDEFAEFKKQFPEQIDKFVQLARVGRSAGIYMVLATQSPSGVVPTQIESNIKFYICLRTANTGESKELIGTTDAFFISRPGRAYVKVGDSIYEQIQTFYSKVPYNPNQDEKEAVTDINLVEINGERVSPKIYDKTIRASEDMQTEGQILVAHIKEIARENNFSKAKPVWTNELPVTLTLSSLGEERNAFIDHEWNEINFGLSFAVGLLDIPEQQRQVPFMLDFAQNGHQILFGAPSSGKTTFLQTAILSGALSYTPNQLQFLILDFGSWSMKTFEELPHTLMVAYANNKEKLQQAEEYLLNELNTRKELFASQGVGTLDAYQQISGRQLPSIIVAIDNITVLNTQYSDMMDSIVKVASEGGSLGIYLLITCVGSSMFKLDNFIKSKHALELTDITEYRSLVGAASKQKPGHFPGRGFTKGPLEFQTALCVEGVNEGERITNLREICHAMKEAWTGQRASIEEAEKREINADELEFNAEGFQIGISKVSKQPVDFTFSKFSTCIIAGVSEDVRNNILGLIINAIVQSSDGEIYLYETNGKISSLYPECFIARNASEADEFISNIADEFDRRSNDDEEDADYRPIVICINDFLSFYRGISLESADILDVLTRSGADFNIYIYMTSSVEDLAFLNTFRTTIIPFDNCLKKGNAIAAGGKLIDYIAFRDLHAEQDIKFAENEGCIIHDNKAVTIKFAKVSRE